MLFSCLEDKAGFVYANLNTHHYLFNYNILVYIKQCNLLSTTFAFISAPPSAHKYFYALNKSILVVIKSQRTN